MGRKAHVLVVSAVFALSPAAFGTGALAAGKGQAKGKDRSKERAVLFVDTDRAAVRAFWLETYGSHTCPPGLARKGNGCLPPGQAKKRYALGRPLAVTVVIDPLPAVLVKRLRPAPEGHRYVVVDGDVLLIATATRLVVDAIANALD